MRNRPGVISIYIDKFGFVEAKKYLALKGPLQLEIVHDSMYPLLRFGMLITVRKAQNGLKPFTLGCYWKEGKLNPCLITKIKSSDSIQVIFLNREQSPILLKEIDFLGEILPSETPLLWRIRFKFMHLKSALFSPQ